MSPWLLTQLLTDAARRHPDAPALECGSHVSTYGELDEESNRLARWLIAGGIRPGDRVAILMRKRAESIVSIFGIMKAGAAYVPIDPDAPAVRSRYILDDCGCRALVVDAQALAALARTGGNAGPLPSLVLDVDETGANGASPWSAIRTMDDAPVAPRGIETDLAYILYTSGSTGQPKGVMITHRTILTFVEWAADRIGLSEADRVTSHAPLHFDLSTFDVFATVKAGGTVVIVPPGLSTFPVRMAELLARERITVTYLVPSLLVRLVTHGELDKHDFPNLRAVLFAGEVFPVKHLRELVRVLPHPDYYNFYGPTETNVCTWHKVAPRDLERTDGRPLPIGVACDDIEVFAVDEAGRKVVEPGGRGELYVRGPCVASGYWNDPDKTARSFVANPFNDRFSERVYRTGDLAYLDDDGETWIYTGRRDNMIKTRGYRVELGEIEACLHDHPGVALAAAVAIPDDEVGNRIKAIVVRADGAEVTARALQSHCRARLPAYMTPDSVEWALGLPTTSTGKVDRMALAKGRSRESMTAATGEPHGR